MISQCLWLMSQLNNPRKLRSVKKWREITILLAAFLGTICSMRCGVFQLQCVLRQWVWLSINAQRYQPGGPAGHSFFFIFYFFIIITKLQS